MRRVKKRRDFSQRDLQERTWLHAASIAGPEGRRWVEGFQASAYFAGLEDLRVALVYMREGDIEAGRAALDRCERLLEEGAAPASASDGSASQAQDSASNGEDSFAEDSFAKVFERFLCGIIAYDRFRAHDYDGAMAALARGERAALEALGEHRFLLTMANIFCEFCVQRARVAREQRDWPALERYLETARQMVISRQPLCVLEDGEEVFVVTIARFFERFELDESDREKIAEFHDEDFLTRRFDKFIYRLPMPRDFVVPFQ